MQTAELLDLMGVLKLYGMRAAFEETLTEGLKRKLSFHQLMGKLFACEIEERKLRSVRYQLGVANLPMTKSLDTFQFAATPINEALIRQWHEGVPVESARNLILVGGTDHAT
jgi:IstB-like ATP binding protein